MPVVNRTKEREIVRKARIRGWSDEKIRRAILLFRQQEAQKSPETAEVRGFGEQAIEDVKGGLVGLGEELTGRGKDIAETFKQTFRREISPIETGVQTFGSIVGGAGDIIGAGLVTGAKALLSDEVEAAIVDKASDFLKTSAGQAGLAAASAGFEAYQEWKGQNPRFARNLESVVNIGSLFPAGKAAQLGVRTAKGAVATGARVTREAAETATTTVARGAEAAEQAGKAVAAAGEGAISTARRVPGRVTANIERRAQTRELVKNLPKETREAVENGVSVRDARIVQDATLPEKEIMKNMTNAAEEYATNRRATDPSEFVGREVQNRIRQADELRAKIGQKQGEAVAKLGSQPIGDVAESVLIRLRRVAGLRGIKLADDGTLDFADTTLSGALTKADRGIIKRAFDDLVDRNASQLHLMRQELFENLGGKKRAMVQYTDTQEQGLEAIRAGIADSLGGVSKQYKKLNLEYRTAVAPLQRMRKFYKNLSEGVTEDILEQRSAILARRLTSNAASAQELSDIFNQLETVLKNAGHKIDVNIEILQDYLNVLNNYFDIVAETGLAGQVRTGLRGVGTRDILGGIVGKAEEFIGVTRDVQQKALKKLLGL